MQTPESTPPEDPTNLFTLGVIIIAMSIGPLMLMLIPVRILQHRPITIDDKFIVCFSVFVSGIGLYRFLQRRRDRHNAS
jgi:hypothetical protein